MDTHSSRLIRPIVICIAGLGVLTSPIALLGMTGAGAAGKMPTTPDVVASRAVEARIADDLRHGQACAASPAIAAVAGELVIHADIDDDGDDDRVTWRHLPDHRRIERRVQLATSCGRYDRAVTSEQVLDAVIGQDGDAFGVTEGRVSVGPLSVDGGVVRATIVLPR